MTTPGAPDCQMMTPVTGSNDGTRSVWADVQLGAPAHVVVPTVTGRAGSLFSAKAVPGPSRSVVLAAVSTPGGAAGNYAATSLNPEGSWSVNQGDFSYNYPISVPASLGGTAPDVTLSYSSQSIDGQTSAQNPQGSQIGDGWTYSPGFIETSYEPCSQDCSGDRGRGGR